MQQILNTSSIMGPCLLQTSEICVSPNAIEEVDIYFSVEPEFYILHANALYMRNTDRFQRCQDSNGLQLFYSRYTFIHYY